LIRKTAFCDNGACNDAQALHPTAKKPCARHSPGLSAAGALFARHGFLPAKANAHWF
jgi:hypothetical protein